MKQVLGSLSLGLALALGLLAMLVEPGFGVSRSPEGYVTPEDVYCVVPITGSLGPFVNCTQVFTTVQAAIDAVSDGEEIRVAEGTFTDIHTHFDGYRTITQTVYISKNLTLKGGYPPEFSTPPDPEAHPTILNAQGQGRVLYIAGDISPTITGFNITGGNATGLFGGISFCPGSICIPTDAGGGCYIHQAGVTLRNNVIFQNMAGVGGGVYLSDSDSALQGNTIITNTGGVGGGIAVFGGTSGFDRNLVRDNTALISQQSALLFVSGNGGGLFLDTDYIKLTNNIIVDNQAEIDGSGIYSFRGSTSLLHNTIARNFGGNGNGIYVYWGHIALTNTMLVSHTVGITMTNPGAVMVDGILWHRTPITISAGGTAIISVTNQFTGDPAFAADGYHLTSVSAAIDRGVNTGVSTDIDGELRDLLPDLGADEFWHTRLYLPIILHTLN
jgi:hypothetical protein